ncbi:MAG: hypothetical protein ABUL60_11970 [Myxococcales bacterium]
MQGLAIPDSLEYEECDHCGARWMTDQQMDIMGDALEAQRQERLQLNKLILAKRYSYAKAVQTKQSAVASGVFSDNGRARCRSANAETRDVCV